MKFATDKDGDVWVISEAHGQAKLLARGEVLCAFSLVLPWEPVEAAVGPLEVFAELAMPEPPSQCNAPGGQS